MKKRSRVTALILALCCALLTGCTKDGEGISLAVCLGGTPESLDPIYAESEQDQTILTHLYENLMRVTVEVSGGTTVTNGMAKSVSHTEHHDGTVTWTFKLRNAKWTDGGSVKAQDFVYAWQRLANPASASPYSSLLSVVAGYDAVRSTGDPTQLQVFAKNDTTLEVVLNGKYDWFLSEVCTSPATLPLRKDVVTDLRDAAVAANLEKEAETGEPGTGKWWSQPKKLVTNGPYRVREVVDGQSLQAATWEKYYGKTAGPKDLTFRFADTPEQAQALYDEREVDLLWPLSDERLAELAADENFVPTPMLGTYTVLFNGGADAFADQTVRQALSLAIDRTALAELAGPLALAAEGLVSPGVPESEEGDFRTVGGALLDNDETTYADRCAQAKALLAQAGYDSGANLGRLEYLYVESDANAAVAKALTEQWREVLHLSVTARGVTEKELRSALGARDYQMAGVDLRPVGNDAEGFLRPWISSGEENAAQYQNSAYDTLMSIIAGAANGAANGAARMGCLHDAEALLLDGAAVAPLYTTGTSYLVRETLGGVCRDARGWFCLTAASPRGA